jgi:hypothetical protein
MLAMFNFFDGIPTRHRFGFYLEMFKSAFIHSVHLSIRGPLGMAFKHFQYLFDPDDSTNDFS